MGRIDLYHDGLLEPGEKDIVREFPLKLVVNNKEIATLICSPHDLKFLVAGFLRLQGFVQSVEDFLMLSVCNDFGVANVSIRGEVPEKLRPVLTSGCGAGISFTTTEIAKDSSANRRPSRPRQGFRPSQIFGMMDQLARLAEDYRSHGGIHSAAVGDGTAVLLHAEDLGRHNTIDRIAGEALLKGIDLSGTMLVTSGRVSTELAAKAAMLGISVIASRTSPTDMAAKMCGEAGIVLIGYVRCGRFTVYTCPEGIACPERIKTPDTDRRTTGTTGALLPRGASTGI